MAEPAPATGYSASHVAARHAEALGARLPPLLVAAERVAMTVAQGVHGRRRVGQGDSFWQFRPFLPGDEARRIDWRQSAKSDRHFIRETEWEAAQTVYLWADGSPSMHWHSRGLAVSKRARAELLLLALASLLLRGGERVILMGPASRALSGRTGLERLALDLAASPAGGAMNPSANQPAGLPPAIRLARHARVVLFGDFLAPLADIQASVAALASVPVGGHILQILDPAEIALPYAGRIKFHGLEREADELVPRVENIRAAYGERLRAQQDGLASLAATAGFTFGVHRTDHPPEAALLALYTALSVT